MKIWIFSIFLMIMIGCKKEIAVSNPQKDTKPFVENLTQDSLVIKPTEPEVFTFATELCDNKGYFDPTKYSREEIEGTYKLWFQNGGASVSTPSVFYIDDLHEVRRDKDVILAKLDKDFMNAKKTLENLIVIDVPYWQNIKKAHIQELKQDYEKKKLQIAAYYDPSVLINNKFTGKCENFTKALNSSDDEMIAEWRKLREEMSKKNGDPQGIINEFENRLSYSNWKEYAMIDLITFGWGNCANAEIERPLHDEKMNNEFNSIFIKIDSECDEP